MTKKTLKVDLPVHAKLYKLSLRYKSKTFSDLIDSMCDYFEISNIKPGDFSVSQKSPNVLFSDGISRIISFIRKSESNYLKDILKYSEKLVVQQSQILEKIDSNTLSNQSSNFEGKPEKIPDDNTQFNLPQNNSSDLVKCKNEIESLNFKINHQTKFINEFISKLNKSSFGNSWSISNEDLQYYKQEFFKISNDN